MSIIFYTRNSLVFKKQNSTAHAITKLTEDIEKSLDNKQSVCAVFIDLQKAFDIVDHSILLNKLCHYGIRDQITGFLHVLQMEINLLQSMTFILIYKMFDWEMFDSSAPYR